MLRCRRQAQPLQACTATATQQWNGHPAACCCRGRTAARAPGSLLLQRDAGATQQGASKRIAYLHHHNLDEQAGGVDAIRGQYVVDVVESLLEKQRKWKTHAALSGSGTSAVPGQGGRARGRRVLGHACTPSVPPLPSAAPHGMRAPSLPRPCSTVAANVTWYRISGYPSASTPVVNPPMQGISAASIEFCSRSSSNASARTCGWAGTWEAAAGGWRHDRGRWGWPGAQGVCRRCLRGGWRRTIGTGGRSTVGWARRAQA